VNENEPEVAVGAALTIRDDLAAKAQRCLSYAARAEPAGGAADVDDRACVGEDGPRPPGSPAWNARQVLRDAVVPVHGFETPICAYAALAS